MKKNGNKEVLTLQCHTILHDPIPTSSQNNNIRDHAAVLQFIVNLEAGTACRKSSLVQSDWAFLQSTL
jgi:hypothetical protein